ncbi:MAG: hypothetical protein V8Q57_08255 [Blautia sp.]
MSDGSAYYYRTTSYGGYTLEVKISSITDKGGKKLPDDHIWYEYTSSSEFEKPTEESIGITLDDAKKLVQEKVDKMGITDLNFYGWDLCHPDNHKDRRKCRPSWAADMHSITPVT